MKMSTSIKVSITLDRDVLSFIDSKSENRSRFINEVLLEAKKKSFLEELKNAYINQSQDQEFQEEIAVWDVVSGDGFNA